MIRKKNILVIMPTLDICGGIESFFMSYYLHLPKHIQVDIITHHSDSEKYQNLIRERGDNLFILPPFSAKNYFKIYTIAKNIIKAKQYDAIHNNMANASFLYLRLSKKNGIKKRILHSHQCKYADKKSHAIRNIILIAIGKKYANSFVACGREAGDFMFKRKNYIVLNNAIDPKKFTKNNGIRNKIRNAIGVKDNEILLASIGRLAPQKNHEFSIKVLASMPQAKLLIIGSGELEMKLKSLVKELKIDDRVTFINSTNNIAEYYNASDALIMPSLYEGLPFVGVEAQFANLPCYFSSNVTKELMISDNCHFLPINNQESVKIWKDAIQKTYSAGNFVKKDSDKYNIRIQAQKLVDLYDGVRHE